MLSSPDNGVVIVDNVTRTGDIATYICLPGYSLVGNLSSGICQLLSMNLTEEENMSPGLIGNISQACEKNNTRLCQSSGVWTGEAPVCQRKQLNSIRVNASHRQLLLFSVLSC